MRRRNRVAQLEPSLIMSCSLKETNDPHHLHGVEFENLNFTSAEMRSQQAEDPTLAAVRVTVEGKASTAGVSFFKRDGLCWRPPGSNGEQFEIEQLVLPMQTCMYWT